MMKTLAALLITFEVNDVDDVGECPDDEAAVYAVNDFFLEVGSDFVYSVSSCHMTSGPPTNADEKPRGKPEFETAQKETRAAHCNASSSRACDSRPD